MVFASEGLEEQNDSKDHNIYRILNNNKKQPITTIITNYNLNTI